MGPLPTNTNPAQPPGGPRDNAAPPPPATVRARPLPSIRLLITLIVVLPVAAASAALVVISTVTSRQVAEQLGDEIVTSATDRVSSEVRDYLGEAMRVSDLYVRRMREGMLPAKAADGGQLLAAWEPSLRDDLLTSPDVASICFGNDGGDAAWLLRAHGRMELGYADGGKGGEAKEYLFDPAAGRADRSRTLRDYVYDPRARPWYKAALDHPDPVWTPVYFWFGEQGGDAETGVGYARVVPEPTAASPAPDGNVAGVLVIDVTLGAISESLRRLPLAQTGYVFIVDDRGLLVASSSGRVTSDQGQRLAPAESGDPAVRAAAGVVIDDEANRPAAGGRIMVNGEPARTKVTPLQPFTGINWRVVTVLPESSFLSAARATQRRSVLLASAAVLGALALGLYLSRRLARPILRLTKHVARVGGGDFKSRLELGQAKELRQLSEELNKMADGLKHRMELQHSLALATQVQQALLPHSPPRYKALDVAGQSR